MGSSPLSIGTNSKGKHNIRRHGLTLTSDPMVRNHRHALFKASFHAVGRDDFSN